MVLKLIKGYRAFQANGFEPQQVIATTTVALDGLESSVRNHSTHLTDLIGQAMLKAVPEASVAIYISGSIRLDDVLLPGEITQYDIIRILPFGGKIFSVEMKGSLLEKILAQGIKNRGTGGYLQTAKVSLSEDGRSWSIDGQPLEPEKIYRVAINDFLVSGKEIGLDFLTLKNPDIKSIEEKTDIRLAVIETFKSRKEE